MKYCSYLGISYFTGINKNVHTVFTCVQVELMYKSTPHFQDQKSYSSSFMVKEVKLIPIEISQKVNLLFLRMY